MKQTMRRLKQDRYIYLMLAPVILYFLVFKYWPMSWLSISFFDYKLLWGFVGSEFVGLQHYLDFFNSIDFWQIMANTVLLNIYGLLFVFTVPIIFALLLNELKVLRFKKFVQTVSYLPYFISIMVVVSMIFTFLSPSVGALNGFLKSMGFEPIYFLGDPKYFRSIHIISGIWQTTGWSAIIYLSTLSGIDPMLYEAATVDGAGRFKQMFHVTLPGLRSTILILFIMQIGKMLNVGFEKVFLLQNPLNSSVSEVLSTYVYKQGIINSNVSYATAIGVFNSVVSLILVLTANWVIKKISKVSIW
ncbi:MAG: ABC transporter permease subunit [Angelakisella sp.]